MSATILAAALMLWYAATTTILPAAIQFSAIPAPQSEAPAPAQAEAAPVCTGMACSIEAQKNGGGCCCSPKAEETSEDTGHPVALFTTKDCGDPASLTLTASRNTWSTPVRFATLLFAPEFVMTAPALHDSKLLPAHPQDIEPIPILLCV